MTTRLILVRHCEAEGNHKRVFQGHTDSEISENGKKQLELLALRCRNMRIDALCSSPLKRAYRTAQAVNRFHNLPIELYDGLKEIDGGSWEGKPWADFPRLYPQQSDYWNYQPHLFAPEGGETMAQLYDRIWNTLLEIVKRHPGQVVCAASHGCAIRNFLCRAKGWPIQRLNDMDWCDNTALSVVDFDEALRPNVVLMNDASHLSAEVSTFAKQTWWQPEYRKRPEGARP